MSEVCGLPLVGMPDDDLQPLSAVVVVKVLDKDGDPAYRVRATEGLLAVEALGMAHYAALRLEMALVDGTTWND